MKLIGIIDVCKVLCSCCGNYLEGVAAVFDDRVVRLCWQDFQIRAMNRGCTHEPSSGCGCWYENASISDSDTHSDIERSTGESDGWSHSEGRTRTQGGSCSEGI